MYVCHTDRITLAWLDASPQRSARLLWRRERRHGDAARWVFARVCPQSETQARRTQTETPVSRCPTPQWQQTRNIRRNTWPLVKRSIQCSSGQLDFSAQEWIECNTERSLCNNTPLICLCRLNKPLKNTWTLRRIGMNYLPCDSRWR